MTDRSDIRPAPQVSDTFRITPSVYFRCALAEPRFLAASVAPAVIILGLLLRGIFGSDMRYILVALMVFFIALPLIMAIIYFNIAFSPGAAQSTLPHTVEIRPDNSLFIRYKPAEEEATERKLRVPHDETIEPGKIKELRRRGNRLIYRLKDGRLVIVPFEALNLNASDTCSLRDFD